MSRPSVVHWFRLDLRVHDNIALRNAINEAENRRFYLRPIYVLDPDVKKKVGANRLRFMIQSLESLNDNLKKLNTQLFIVRGKCEETLPKLFEEWQVKCLTTQVDIDRDITKQDASIEKYCKEKDINIIRKNQHTIYDYYDILKRNHGSVPVTYQKFLSIVQNLKIKEIVENTKKISNECNPPNCKDTEIPKLKDLGLDESNLSPCKYPGGETEALKRLDKYMSKKQWVCNFEKPKTSPNSIEPSTTVLSPYLSHGCLSANLFFHKLREIEKSCSQHSQPPTSLRGQLMWREFYYTAGAGCENYDKMAGNPICIQIPWAKNEKHLKAWAEGRTGYPFVDAIMRQLKQEGWIHHLGRHMVACFLTRGDLYISWEEGAKVFEDYLLDYDWSVNSGNWMWLSASAFFYKFIRVYSPIAFGKKTDKEGTYIKKYVPELKDYPSEFIYEPWKAPKAIQQKAGCLIGEGYPERIVNHDTASKEIISKMSIAYKKNRQKKEKRSPKRVKTE